MATSGFRSAWYRLRSLQVRGNTTQCLHLETPLVHSESFSRQLGAEVFLKLDCLQPPGSFKIRGIGETVRSAVQDGARQMVSSSGGNAGLAAAFAARQLGVPLIVVLPTTTPQKVHERLRTYGAEVVVHGDVWDEANEHALRLVQESENTHYVHPFDQPSTWRGHATLVTELKRQFPAVSGRDAPDALVTCVGGGGLLMGILEGLEQCGWRSTRVLACETEGAASMAKSLEARKLVTLPAIDSLAKSLGARTVGEEIFKYCLAQGSRVQTFTMTDRQAVQACVRFASEHRLLVEPACGAALAAVLERSPALMACETVVVEVCGGALVDLATLQAWASEVHISFN